MTWRTGYRNRIPNATITARMWMARIASVKLAGASTARKATGSRRSVADCAVTRGAAADRQPVGGGYALRIPPADPLGGTRAMTISAARPAPAADPGR